MVRTAGLEPATSKRDRFSSQLQFSLPPFWRLWAGLSLQRSQLMTLVAARKVSTPSLV